MTRWEKNQKLRPRIFIRGSVRPLVRRSVSPSVGRSVMRFFSIAKMKVFLHVCHQEGPVTSQKCRIASLVGLLVRWSICDFCLFVCFES